MYFQSCRSSWKLQFHEGLSASKLPRWRWNRYRPVVPSEVPDKCLPTLRRRAERHVHRIPLRQRQFAFAETGAAAADTLQLIAQWGAIHTKACDLQHGSPVQR
ncbi:hypothetical protein CSB90_6515 [Pseudomonas aeruginosa]|nr:hypothetical protein CSB90_6515 [Pseudomonas aeruginosa]